MSKQPTKPRGKITIKNNKNIGKIWHQESTLVFKSAKEKLVIGRCENNKIIPLDDEALELCTQWKFKYDTSLVEEVDEGDDTNEEESEEEEESDKKTKKFDKDKQESEDDDDESEDDESEESKEQDKLEEDKPDELEEEQQEDKPDELEEEQEEQQEDKPDELEEEEEEQEEDKPDKLEEEDKSDELEEEKVSYKNIKKQKSKNNDVLPKEKVVNDTNDLQLSELFDLHMAASVQLSDNLRSIISNIQSEADAKCAALNKELLDTKSKLKIMTQDCDDAKAKFAKIRNALGL